MAAAAFIQRAPEKTLLYGTIQRNFETFAELFESRSGGSLPKYIRREFESYLACGIPAHGFLQVTCTECGDSSILPFSCRRRGFCPSCGARKMAEEAAFLTDWVLPSTVGYRQYVLTFPMPLRFWIARNGGLLSQMYRIFSAEVRRFVEERSELLLGSGARKSAGTVSFIQRFGDGLRYNPHIHLCASEGAWVESEGEPGGLQFVPSEVPTPEEVCTLLERIQSRIVRHLRRLGLIRKEETSSAETSGSLEFEPIEKDRSPEEELLGEMQGCSTQNRFALSVPPGKAVRRERQTELGEFGKIGDRARLSSDGGRLAILKGFSLHAGTSVPPKQDGDPPEAPGQGGLERLLRYMARNSTPLERLKPASNGDVLIKLRSRWTDGTTHLRFSGVELCERLAALIPTTTADCA